MGGDTEERTSVTRSCRFGYMAYVLLGADSLPDEFLDLDFDLGFLPFFLFLFSDLGRLAGAVETGFVGADTFVVGAGIAAEVDCMRSCA